MFEKEAEEYTGKVHRYKDNLKELIQDEDVFDAFQDGAEFGYNKAKKDADKMKSRFLELCNLKDMRIAELEKANEWHYVKDGDLPKETGLLMSKTLLLVTKMKGSDCLSLTLGEYNFSTQEFSYQHIVGLTDVIAWKEIVLSELKEGE